MARKSIEDMINEIEIFIDSCKFAALSSNKIVVPKDEIDSMLSELKMKMPAEIERCKKIMRNKEAILADARQKAEGVMFEANQEAARLVSEHEITVLASNKSHEMIETARAQANEMIQTASAESNELRLGSMEYTKDMLKGIRHYMYETFEAEQKSFTTLLETLQNDSMIADANLNEIENQIAEFHGIPRTMTEEMMRSQTGQAKSRQEAVAQAQAASRQQAAAQAQTVSRQPVAQTQIAGRQPVVVVQTKNTNGQPIGQPQTTQPAGQAQLVGQPSQAQTGLEQVASRQSVVAQETDADVKIREPRATNKNIDVSMKSVAMRNAKKEIENAEEKPIRNTQRLVSSDPDAVVSAMEAKVTRSPRVGKPLKNEQVTDVQLELELPDNSAGILDDYQLSDKDF